ncbi:hypothetical protein [Streptomyces mirabilis]|uniref:hypothetical protein n=1 Tax=Streptomyces mirabilis TaxID=68239 RepID=UPI0015A5C72E|nr:hypothetical protein [Streptomyces mirabilis]
MPKPDDHAQALPSARHRRPGDLRLSPHRDTGHHGRTVLHAIPRFTRTPADR